MLRYSFRCITQPPCALLPAPPDIPQSNPLAPKYPSATPRMNHLLIVTTLQFSRLFFLLYKYSFAVVFSLFCHIGHLSLFDACDWSVQLQSTVQTTKGVKTCERIRKKKKMFLRVIFLRIKIWHVRSSRHAMNSSQNLLRMRHWHCPRAAKAGKFFAIPTSFNPHTCLIFHFELSTAAFFSSQELRVQAYFVHDMIEFFNLLHFRSVCRPGQC